MARTARLLTANGQTMTLQAWSVMTGISFETIKSRLRLKWTPEEALGFVQHVNNYDATQILNQPNQFDNGTGSGVLERQAAFLDAYLDCGKVTIAADMAGVDHSTYYRWLDEDEVFKDSCQRIYDWTTQKLRDKVITMLELPDQYKTLIQHPNVLFFELKHRDPKYKDNFELNVYNNQLSLGDTEQAIKALWTIEQARKLNQQNQKLLTG